MAEYIEKEKAARVLREEAAANYPTAFHVGLYAAARAIDSIPAADVRPVVRGKWKLDSDPGEPWRYVCNICGEKTKDTVMGKPRANYCPHCGADMRGEADE